MPNNDLHYRFTSESVSDGHPDKLADRIADAVLDRCLTLDPNARVCCETMVANQLVVVAGELRLAPLGAFEALREEIEGIARAVLRDTGYHRSFPGIDPDQCKVITRIHRQCPPFGSGVDRSRDVPVPGEQGAVFGYACNPSHCGWIRTAPVGSGTDGSPPPCGRYSTSPWPASSAIWR
jgi:S-adenosylmethionine synthetase